MIRSTSAGASRRRPGSRPQVTTKRAEWTRTTCAPWSTACRRPAASASESTGSSCTSPARVTYATRSSFPRCGPSENAVKRPLSRLEFEIAWRYLRSRRGSRLLSFITVIAIGGIVVGGGGLIVIIGVMNGLQTDLREKILVGSPDIRVLAYGEDLRIPGWKPLLETVRKKKGVVAAAPFALTEALMRKDPGTYFEAVSVAGIAPKGDGGAAGTTIRAPTTKGDVRVPGSAGNHPRP